ncbi:MAG TPA: hypothetical protein VMZ28_02675 [Kofleriaceae bacterium]|nr:hypothetical protein [Kofleriaceae bacterium]
MNNRLALLSLALAGACSAQADSDYEGDLLASLDGQVTSSREVATPDAEAMAIWLPLDDYEFLVPTTDRVDVEGSFPSAFRLDLTEPPPHEGSIDGTGSIAIGILTVASADLTQEDILQEDGPPEGLLLGVEENHMLLWIGDGGPGTTFADMYGFTTLAPGYHVLDVLGIPKAEEDQVDACRDAALSEEDDEQCTQLERGFYEQHHPDETWDGDVLLDKIRVAADDLDAELAIDLKDSLSEMNFPEFD